MKYACNYQTNHGDANFGESNLIHGKGMLLKIAEQMLSHPWQLKIHSVHKKFCDACGVLKESLKPRNEQYYIIFPWQYCSGFGFLTRNWVWGKG